MILDRVFHGVLDHSAGCLIVFEEQGPDVWFSSCLTNLVEDVRCGIGDGQTYEHGC